MFILVLSFASLVLLFSKSVETRLVLVFLRYLRAVRLMLMGMYRSMPDMFRRRKTVKRSEEVEEAVSVLDLPELVLDSILERLSPVGLCNMSRVCCTLKDRCRSDHLWGRHLREKWGDVIGEAAYMKWQCFAAAKEEALNDRKVKWLIRALSRAWPISWMRSKFDAHLRTTSSLPANSAMSWYLALESGKFWLPAQVYNRENGHSGFMLSCYDAELSYDWHTDTFRARYPPHGKRAIVYEDAIPWDRIRAPPVDTSPHELHVSDCLNDLYPGDHIEIQWRRNKEFPYGWWYGVVGHLESCDGNELHCRCHRNDTVALEFNHYAEGSRWRRANISRKDHREEGNETDGFYGGIRKLTSEYEISTWRRIWPRENLDQA